MASSNGLVAAANDRLSTALTRMLREQPFYAALAIRLRLGLDNNTPTAYTDGKKIAFSPEFMKRLSENELQFVLMHEVMHVALGHCEVDMRELDPLLLNIACDIVVNSNILYSFDMRESAITFDGEVAMHKAPDGKEGYLYTYREVYDMLIKKAKSESGRGGKSGKNSTDGKGKGEQGGEGEQSQNSQSGTQQSSQGGKNQSQDGSQDGKSKKGAFGESGVLDDHSRWQGDKLTGEDRAEIAEKIVAASEIASELENLYTNVYGDKSCGKLPLGAARKIGELKNPEIDWRTMLENFIQEEINDYSFSPPDRRFSDTGFFLPDFNDREATVKNIVFLVDTSGSMSDAMINSAYSEIKGAIDQFDGKFEGFAVAADAKAYEIVPFGEETDIRSLIPFGGGGTNFEAPIRYVLEEMKDEPPACMIYITDGYCAFPSEEITDGIPFLWLMTTDVIPPWGKHARIHP